MLSFVVVNILFNVFPIVCGSSVFVFVLLCITLCPFWFCNHLEEEEKLIALPPGAVGLSAVCDFGISWSYSLTFWH